MKLDEKMMKNLSFPDCEIEKFEFFPKEKILKIFLDGAWLDIDDGCQLGKGFVSFDEWENLLISRFSPKTEKWSPVDELTAEFLSDICEVKFSSPIVSLYGFGEKIGHWMEWKIYKAKMHAEFSRS